MEISYYVARQRTIMYSYNVYKHDEKLDQLVLLAQSGDVKVAREGLREFVKKHPNKLLAWKWMADVASSVKERSDAIRRAQLLAPGDPWVIEAKKHSRPPIYGKGDDSTVENNIALDVEKNDKADLVEHIEDPVIVSKISDINYGNKSSDFPSTKTYRKKEQQNIKTGQKSEQPSWLIWVAAIMGIAGVVLLTIAWSMN